MVFEVIPQVAGEIMPSVVAFVIGMILGTQMSGPISRRQTALILLLSIVAAFLFESPIFTWSLLGGYIAEGVSLAIPFITATIGILAGKALKGDK